VPRNLATSIEIEGARHKTPNERELGRLFSRAFILLAVGIVSGANRRQTVRNWCSTIGQEVSWKMGQRGIRTPTQGVAQLNDERSNE
jgi:hypothetical protein